MTLHAVVAREAREIDRRQRGARIELRTENALPTSDKEFASAARSDDLLARVLGKSLDRATLRLGLIVVVACAIAGTVALLTS